MDAARDSGSGGVVGAVVPEGIAPPIAPPDAPSGGSAPPAEQRVVPLKSAPPPSKPAVAPVPASAGGASDSQADAGGEYEEEEEEKVHLLLLADATATATAPTAPPQASSQPTARPVHTPRVEEAAQEDKRLRTTRPKSVRPKGFATATREDGYVYMGNHLHVSFRRTPILGPHSGRTVLDLTTHFRAFPSDQPVVSVG